MGEIIGRWWIVGGEGVNIGASDWLHDRIIGQYVNVFGDIDIREGGRECQRRDEGARLMGKIKGFSTTPTQAN